MSAVETMLEKDNMLKTLFFGFDLYAYFGIYGSSLYDPPNHLYDR